MTDPVLPTKQDLIETVTALAVGAAAVFFAAFGAHVLNALATKEETSNAEHD